MNKNKKGSFISFILPYVLILGIVIGVLIMFNGLSSAKTISLNNYDVITFTSEDREKGGEEFEDKLEQSFLWSEDVKSLTITPKPASGVMVLEGEVAMTVNEKKDLFSFTGTYLYSDENVYAINYIINNRVEFDADGNPTTNQYYNKTRLT